MVLLCIQHSHWKWSCTQWNINIPCEQQCMCFLNVEFVLKLQGRVRKPAANTGPLPYSSVSCHLTAKIISSAKLMCWYKSRGPHRIRNYTHCSLEEWRLSSLRHCCKIVVYGVDVVSRNLGACPVWPMIDCQLRVLTCAASKDGGG